MTINVRKISKSEVPPKIKTYRPELSQSNGHKAEMLASLLDMSIADVVNQIFAQAGFIELISEKKGIAVPINGPIGLLDQSDFETISSAINDYENNLPVDDDNSTSPKKVSAEDLGESELTIKPTKTVSGIGSALLGDDENLDLDAESEGFSGDEDLEEEANNI